MTHQQKMDIARLLAALSQEDQALDQTETIVALDEVRAALKPVRDMVRGYLIEWQRPEA